MATYQYRIWCNTESAWVFTWSNDTPTECPNNAGHSIDTDSITIVDSVYSRYIVTAGEDLGTAKAVYISGDDEAKLAKGKST